MQTGQYPDILKIAKVTALYKGELHYYMTNYRPIFVLSPFNKIFEVIIKIRIMGILRKMPSYFSSSIWISPKLFSYISDISLL